MKMNGNQNWSLSRSEEFWRDIAPGEHVLQVYENKASFIDTLAAFVGAGINAGDSAIIIAFPEHIHLLEEKLIEHVLQLETLKKDDRLIFLDAEETLQSLMTGDLPQPEKFESVISALVKKAAGREGRKVRAFGEMVAILSQAGNFEGTRRLEELWNSFCNREGISLLCAYPKNLIEEGTEDQYRQICNCHSKIVKDTAKPLIEILYRDTKIA
jgi:hypothetical protein